jgi:hypothetical protein
MVPLTGSLHHFHEDRLRACPATEQPAESHREHNYENDEGHHCESEYEEILWPEYSTKQDKPAFYNIEQKQRPAIHLNEWAGKKRKEIKEAQNTPRVIEFTFRFQAIDPATFPLSVNSCQVVSECFFHHEYF